MSLSGQEKLAGLMKIRDITLTALIASLTTIGTITAMSSLDLEALVARLHEEYPTSANHQSSTPDKKSTGFRVLHPLMGDTEQKTSVTRKAAYPGIAERKPCVIVGTRFKSTSESQMSHNLPSADEVHAIGIHEVDSARPYFPQGQVRDRVPVCIDRPGKSVLLLLASYDPVRWQIQVSKETKLAGVVFQGHGARGSGANFYGRYLHEDIPAYAVTPEIRAPYKELGDRFRAYARIVPQRYGADRLASFDGSYSAPAAGFRIETVEDQNERLKPDPLADRISGQDLLTPALNTQLQIGLPSQAWRFTSEGFFGAGSEPVIATPLGVDISWTVNNAAYDEKTNRVFGVASHVFTRIYRGDLDSGDFLQLAEMRGPDMSGVIWNSRMGKLVVTGMASHGQGDPQILLVDPETGYLDTISFDTESFIGLTDLYDPGNGPAPDIVPLAVDGNLLVVAARGGQSGPWGRGDQAGSRTWLVDLDSKEVHLLAYTVDRSEERAIKRRVEDERRRDARDRAQKAAEAAPKELTERDKRRIFNPTHQTTQGAAAPTSSDENNNATSEAGEAAASKSTYAQAVQQIKAVVWGTKTLYASRASYNGLSSNLLQNAGILSHPTHVWGGQIAARGGPHDFTITFKDVPAADCEHYRQKLAVALSPSGVFAVMCKSGDLEAVAR